VGIRELRNRINIDASSAVEYSGAHLSWLKLDLNLGWVGAFVKDREGELLVCFVEFVSGKSLDNDAYSHEKEGST